jgi:glycosyltransferase involved in cell wall biosynthesis
VRILILNWRDPSHPWAGGAEVFLYELAKRWIAAGHQITWYSSCHPSQCKTEQESGFQFIRGGGFFSVFLTAPLYYLANLSGRFDVIVDSANGIPFFTPLYTSTPRIALVHHVHKQVFFCELPRGLAHIANLLEQYATPLIYRNTPFITVSESSRQALVEIGIPEGQISLIYNGVDCERYHPGKKSETPLIVYLGRLRHYKSVDIAIRALPLLTDSFPDVSFGIAGSGPAEADLRSLAHELGVADRVQFFGHVSDDAKVVLLQQAHVVVNPSLKEGWGLTVLEANACGTPVVGADVPGLRDSICHRQTGYLVPYGDHTSMAGAIKKLLGNLKQRQEMEERALQWGRRFSWDVSADKCLRILEYVANGKIR